ncbi:hypothetical protein FQZ97_584170 [compost metagenome]
MHAGQQLVDDLHLAARAGRIAQAVDLGGHRVEHRAGLFIRRGGAGGHHRHLAARGLGGAAGDRRVEVQDALLRKARLERHRPVRVDGGAHHEQAAGLHRCRAAGRGAVAEQHRLGLRRVDDHADHDVALRAERGQRVARGAAIAREGCGDAGAHVEHMRRMARAAQRLRHAAAHGAQAHEADDGGGVGRRSHVVRPSISD